MELIEGKNIWIAPTKREAKVMARCLMNQGDMRGFVVHELDQDPYLIVFDSYGNTHHSCVLGLGLNQRALRVEGLEPLIFWKNGGILIDTILPWRGPIRAGRIFNNAVVEVLDAIAKGVGAEYAWLTNNENDVIK